MTKYLKVYANTRMLTTLLLGFSSGLPLALTLGTMQAWLTQAQVDIGTIGICPDQYALRSQVSLGADYRQR